jgi:phosphoenolpyruvate carboxylase
MNEQLRQEVRFLTTRLGAMVREQSGPGVFSAIEVLRKVSKQIRQNPNPKLLKARDRALRRLSVEQAAAVGRESVKRWLLGQRSGHALGNLRFLR